MALRWADVHELVIELDEQHPDMAPQYVNRTARSHYKLTLN